MEFRRAARGGDRFALERVRGPVCRREPDRVNEATPGSRSTAGDGLSTPMRGAVRLFVGAVAIALLLSAGCASRQPEKGFHYTVRKGDSLYAIGQRYGVKHDTLRRVNGISDVTRLQIGTRVWIPGKSSASASPPSEQAHARAQARRDAKLRFGWPLKGRLTSPFGSRNGRPHEGIDLAAPRGTVIRAAEAGKVIHSGRLGAYGRVVILKHAGHYRTVYAHANRTTVGRGDFVEQGEQIATVGSTGRSTGPHLHFEVRRRETPRDPLLYLP